MSVEQKEKYIEALKEKAGAWHKRYEEAVDGVLNMEKADKEKLIEVLWEYGILGRVAPKDLAEKKARQELRKAVWEGDRGDPELYWRILYSAGQAKEAQKRNYSIIAGSGSFINGIFEGLYKVLYSQRVKEFFPEVKKGQDPIQNVINAMMERAKLELRQQGVETHQPLIPWGAKGKYKGMNVKVARYTEDGGIWLESDGWEIQPVEFYKRLDWLDGVPPNELKQDDFVIPEPKKS